ncbi:MAG: TonB-dependent receptor plug domain-containing protein, partial [Methylomonas sp.]
MDTYESIFKQKQLIIGLGIILGLSSADLLAAPDSDQTVQTPSSDQTKQNKKPKHRKKANKTNRATQVEQSVREDQSGQTQNSVAPNPADPAKHPSGQSEQTKPLIKSLKTEELGEITVVSGRSRNLLGMTNSASQGVISQEQIQFRAVSRPGELVELIPGMIATQHSGSGKANQYFLRGYNLDHGTDFTTVVDGIPMNLPSNAHGQGYMDLNSMIPELVDKIEYGKGPYYAEIGDFAAAGFNKMTTMKTLSKGFVKFTGGEFDFYRTVAANSSKLGDDGNLLYAAEFQTYNGAWAVPENGHKYNALIRYTQDHEKWGTAVNAKAYTNEWTATNQQAQSFLDTNGLYSNISPSDMGNTNRYSFSTNLWNKGEDWKNDANLYAVYYDLSLFSNLTGYLTGPWGDQINQKERRVYVGGNEELTHYDKLFGLDMDNTYGMSFRHDEVMGLGLNQTVNRQYLNTISDDNVSESTGGLYFKNQIHWNEKFRTIQSLRADFITMQVTSLANGYTNGNAAVLGAAASPITAASPAIAAGAIEAADPTL